MFCNYFDLLIKSEEDAVDGDDSEDEGIKPLVKRHHVDDLVSEWIGHREAAQRYRGVVL